MSNPAKSKPPFDPAIGLMCTVADHLIPLFKTGSIDTPLARRMALSAIEAYQPETRADYVNVARTIAFSIAALALLGKSASEGMTMPEQMRAYGRANALNRSADQSERTMMQRRRYLNAQAPAEQPGQEPEPPAPDPENDDAEIGAAIAEAMLEHAATRTPSSPKPPAPETRATPPTATPAAAIHYNKPQPASFKADLLANSAIQRIITEVASQNPGYQGSV